MHDYMGVLIFLELVMVSGAEHKVQWMKVVRYSVTYAVQVQIH